MSDFINFNAKKTTHLVLGQKTCHFVHNYIFSYFTIEKRSLFKSNDTHFKMSSIVYILVIYKEALCNILQFMNEIYIAVFSRHYL